MSQRNKKHIHAARQILVGVVPNPTSQIDQITNALIYKFMDDYEVKKDLYFSINNSGLILIGRAIS